MYRSNNKPVLLSCQLSTLNTNIIQIQHQTTKIKQKFARKTTAEKIEGTKSKCNNKSNLEIILTTTATAKAALRVK